jgi:polar amino acid transport system substrate-binding protein
MFQLLRTGLLRVPVFLGAWLAIAGFTDASDQFLPNHVDPTAREIQPSSAPIAAIRFLTTADFPPFNFRDANGELIGFNVDLAKRICAEVNVACTLQAWPWDQAVEALVDNQGDALIAGISIESGEDWRLDFSATYLALPGRFVTTSANAVGFSTNSIDASTVAVRTGSAHEKFMQRYFPHANLVRFATELAALDAVRSGQASSFFGDALRASFWLNENLDCCSFASQAFFRPGLFGEGLTIAVPAGNDAVRHALNWALAELKENGGLDELYLRWFPVGFY